VDVRARKLQTATTVFKAARVVFVLGGAGFAIAAIIVAFRQAPEAGIPGAIGIAVAGTMIGLVFSMGAWFGVGSFLHMAEDNCIQLFGPQFEHDLTGRTDYWDERAARTADSGDHAPSLADIDFETELTTALSADGLEETLEIPAAMLFTKDDLRGNVDLVVGAQDGVSPDRLTQALLRHLQLGFEGRQTRLSPLAHEENDSDSEFSVVLGYSVTDMIGEFERPRLEQWIDEKAAEPGVVIVYWDDRQLGMVRLVVAD
jgi:hypothetical protein